MHTERKMAHSGLVGGFVIHLLALEAQCLHDLQIALAAPQRMDATSLSHLI